MSFADEHLDSPPAQLTPLTAHERRLLDKTAWTTDELISLAFIARRLAERVDRALQQQKGEQR
jgi:hypothetical protein